jgi:two-component system CheB/CheR fusion protein
MAKKKRSQSAKTPDTPKAAPRPIEHGEPVEKAPLPVEDISDESKPLRPGPPVAGIGASAGGLDAFKKFFAAMPPDSGIAFVLVPHLDPAHESLMVELLARHTVMPVVEAGNDMPVEADHVYVIPPNKYMTIHDGILRLTGPVERRGSQTSIDLFLRSLANDQQERSICIILSGTGSHGALGLKAVKAAGGMAMVQDPATAEYERMPQSAVDTGLADYILPPEQMPEALIKYSKHVYFNGGLPMEAVPEAVDHLAKVIALLRTRTKFDFRCYRKKMLTRRIERRMGLNHLDSIPDYVKFLRDHPDELKLLVKDLFISVTSFFRDPDAFRELANQVIAPLVTGKEADDVIRVWVPGCATGEEPYSIAILLLEQMAAAHENCRLQVFATDVDEDALEVARQGLYPDSITADISQERLGRFFTRVDEQTYQVNKQLRESVIFAVQNLISDAPFTRLDLISCRNLLIYLEPDVQKKVITLFHFALNDSGSLFLGPSETVGRQFDLFESLSKKWRIYRRIGPARPERVDFPIAAATGLHGAAGRRQAEAAGVPPLDFAEVTQRLLLDQYAPAAVLINRKYEILYYFGPCAQYLELPAGEPTHDLIRMARDGLRTKLRGAIHRAIRENERVLLTDIKVKRNGDYRAMRATVRPIQVPRAAEGLLLITFEEDVAAPAPSMPAGAPPGHEETADESTVRQLEYELKATREDLQSTIEEMESSNEELKASNEEIMSMNEELQSANEELETSKEELQSLNEELSTVNNQLQEKVQELESANNDITNLLNCTDIATIFLDTAFRIKRFTPAATRLFNLIGSDVGRSIGDITARVADSELLGDAQQVLQHLVPREKEVSTADGGWWTRRIMPYRTRDNRIEGVVLTFADATLLKRANEILEQQVADRTQSVREREERLEAILNTATDAIITINPQGIIQSANPAAERMFGYAGDEMIGQNVKMLMPSPYRDEHDGYLEHYRKTREKHMIGIGREVEARRKDGSIFPVDLAVSEIEHLQLFTGTIRDNTRRKELEREVVEIASLEQRRIGQDLHDSVGQELTALNMLTRDLTEIVRTDPEKAASLAEKVVQGLQRSQQAVRGVLRGLLLVVEDSQGLPAALADLTERANHETKARCTLDCPAPVALTDSMAATHLYLIAQEAIHNATKHAQASDIRVSLKEAPEGLVLRIQDDGIGMPARGANSAGVGLRIMRNRAAILGAKLTIAPADSKGTMVTCVLPRRGHEAKTGEKEEMAGSDRR